jgi:hypothetical protein
MTDYKKYSLEHLENWMYDAMSCAEATPQEIYDVIKSVVEDNYHTYKHQTSQAYELLALLNGNGKGHLTCDKDDLSEDCKKSWSDFWTTTPYTEEEIDAMCDAAEEQEKKKTWTVPVEEDDLGEYLINLPAELIEIVGWVENDILEWIDNKNGSFTLKKVIK